MKPHKISKEEFMALAEKLKEQGVNNLAVIYFEGPDCWWVSNLQGGLLSFRNVLFTSVIPDLHRRLCEEGSEFMAGIDLMLSGKKVCPHCNQIIKRE